MPVVGTAALVGAAVGAGTALITGGNVLKGALFGGITGAAGGALGGAFAGEAGGVAAAGEGAIDVGGGLAIDTAAADASGLAQMAADAGLTGDAAAAFAESGGALGSTAADGATALGTGSGLTVPKPTELATAPPAVSDTTGQAAGKQLIDLQGTAATPPQAPTAPSAPAAPSPSVTNPVTSPPQGIIQQGMTAPPVTNAQYETSGLTDLASRTGETALDGLSTPPSGTDPTTWQKILKWGKENQTVTASLLQGGGNLLGGVGKGIGDYQTAVTKATLDEQNKEKLLAAYRAFVQQGSTGGTGGVNVGVTPAANVALRRPNGGLVFNAMGLNRPA